MTGPTITPLAADAPFGIPRVNPWRTHCTATDVTTLETLSRLIEAALVAGGNAADLDARAEEYPDADYHSLWIGLLIGTGACTTFEQACNWATFVRYHTEDLIA
jgi:hypothetical protein